MNRILMIVIIPVAAASWSCGGEREQGAVSTGSSPATTHALATQPSFHPDDRAVIEAALLAFLADREVHVFDSKLGRTILVEDHTVEKTGMIGDAQLSGELAKHDFPPDAIQNLRDRGGGKFPLVGLGLTDPRIVLTGEKAFGSLSWKTDFAAAFPEARAWVSVWLPGYTKDGSRAVLRFWFGPTPHGATATYFLRRDDAGRWVVVTRKLSYYA